MTNTNENSTLTNVVKFTKEQGVWYVNLPELLNKGSVEKETLKLTEELGAFLDTLSEDGANADLLISTGEFVGYEGVLQLSDSAYAYQRSDNGPASVGNPDDGEKSQKGFSFPKQGFKPIATYVFSGEYPEKMYIRTVNTRTDKIRKTIYHLIVDKSGSMRDCVENTVSGINEQIEKAKQLQQKYPEEEITIGLSTFNDTVNHIIELSNPAIIPPLQVEDYTTVGGTALLDAIGLVVKKIEDIQVVSAQKIPTTAVIIVITDGKENSSRYFKLDYIKESIERLEKTGKWTFSFLGANIDSFHIANKMGMRGSNSRDFEKRLMCFVWDELDESMESYLEKKRRGRDFSDYFEK